MKQGAILLILSIRSFAAPLFWEHPNVAISLAEPSLPFGQVLNISSADLAKESPQNQIWSTGGLVGYFTTEWKAPIWTSTNFDWRFDPTDEPQSLSPQVPTHKSPPLVVPSDPTTTHPFKIPISTVTHPQLIYNIPNITQVPEPPSGLVIIWLVGLLYGYRRTKSFLSTR